MAAIRAARWAPVVLSVIGVALIGWALAMEGRDKISGLLIELGSVFLLFGPLLWLEQALERSVRDLRTRTKATEESVDQLSRDLEGVRSDIAGLRDLRAAMEEALATQIEDDRRVFADFADQPLPFNLYRIYQRATELNAIANGPFRVPIGGTDLRLRVRGINQHHGTDRNIVGATWTFNLEEPDGEQVAQVHWRDGEQPTTLGLRVAKELQKINRYPGNDQFDFPMTMQKFSADLDRAIKIRQRSTEAPEGIAPLIEVIDEDWALTKFGLERLSSGRTGPLRLSGKELREEVPTNYPDDGDQSYEKALELARAYAERNPRVVP